MKHLLRANLQLLISQNIRSQRKEDIVIEVVRLMLDEPTKLGVFITPALDSEMLLKKKTAITKTLLEMYSRYTTAHARLSDIITDVLFELDAHGLDMSVCEDSLI